MDTQPIPEQTTDPQPHDPARQRRFWPLVLGSMGVVFGDIGTSPLYAFREAVHAVGGGAASPVEIIGILSLIIWSILLIVTVKYVLVLLNADNHGEGGTLALMALAQRTIGRRSGWLLLLGMMGAALFYGDAAITPAISVLSAVEGLELASPAFEPWIVPLALTILITLFLNQSKGTHRVSRLFGPVTAVWFLAMAAAGLPSILRYPDVLAAFNPVHGVALLLHHGKASLVVMGAVFLAVTGAEALYADLGHFGKKPIRFAWLWLVLPALLINYLGQAALVLAHPETYENPFFLLVPDMLLLPMVGLATLATIIASQAVITGAFSMTRQAVQLGLMPRVEIRHTSEENSGQIYLPRANLWLLIGVVLLVLMFESSSRLASAYGIAVTGAMVIDTLMVFFVIWKIWSVRWAIAVLLVVPFLMVEGTFFSANLMKFAEGGWLPLLSGGSILLAMITWVRGSRILYEKQRKTDVPMTDLLEILAAKPPVRVPGTAVFLTANPVTAPSALLHNLKHNKVLHEQNVVLSITYLEQPRACEEERVTLTHVSPDFIQIQLQCGFMETPNVLRALATCRQQGWKFDVMQTTFFLSRRSVRPAVHSSMPLWQDILFISLVKNATAATDFFRLPADQVMEVGTHVKI